MKSGEMCENSMGRIVHPGCFHGHVARMLTVHYDKHGDIEQLFLCDECCKIIKKNARRHGYKTRSNKV